MMELIENFKRGETMVLPLAGMPLAGMDAGTHNYTIHVGLYEAPTLKTTKDASNWLYTGAYVALLHEARRMDARQMNMVVEAVQVSDYWNIRRQVYMRRNNDPLYMDPEGWEARANMWIDRCRRTNLGSTMRWSGNSGSLWSIWNKHLSLRRVNPDTPLGARKRLYRDVVEAAGSGGDPRPKEVPSKRMGTHQR